MTVSFAWVVRFGPKLRRSLVFLLLGFASGLPLSLTGSTLQTWLTVEGVDVVTLGFFILIGLPYTFKFLWAPLLDRFDLPWLGRRCGLIVSLQCALAATLVLLSFLSPHDQQRPFIATACIIAFFSATLDVLIDGYRTELMPLQERGLGSAFAVLGYRVAMIFSGGISLIWAAQGMSWPHIYRLFSIVLCVTALLSVTSMPRLSMLKIAPNDSLVREIFGFIALVIGGGIGAYIANFFIQNRFSAELPSRWTRFITLIFEIIFATASGIVAARLAGYKALQRSLQSYFAMQYARSFLVLVVLYKIGDAFAMSLLTPFLLNYVGLDQMQIGIAHKSAGLVMAVIGAMIGGILLLRMRLSSALISFAILQAVVIVGFYLLAIYRQGLLGNVLLPALNFGFFRIPANTSVDVLFLLTLSLDNLFNGMGTAALVALLSRLSNIHFSASHYALLSACASFGRILLGPVTGVVADAFGWSCFFITALYASIPGIIAVWYLRNKIDDI